MKRVTAVLICVLIIIGFASCGGNDNDNKQTTSQKAYNTVFKQNTSVVPNTTTAAESETSTTVGEDVSGEIEVVETTVARTGKRKFYKQTSAMRNITSAEFLQEINAGIVLGDSFSVSGVGFDKSVEDYETAMENPVVAEGLIDAYKSAGFKAVKVPVSWTEHIDENGVINEKWLNRIDEVINMIVSKNMYCIINSQNDTSWLTTANADFNNTKQKFSSMWKAIAEKFKNYNDRLLFESAGEILKAENDKSAPSSSDIANNNTLNKIFVSTVRKTGGNNKKRHLVISTYGAFIDSASLNGFKVPSDTVKNKLIAKVNMYIPASFCFDESKANAWGKQSDKDYINSCFAEVNRRFSALNIPVMVGEFGAIDKGNESARASYAGYFVSTAYNYYIPCFWFDDGKDFRLVDRSTFEVSYKKVLSGIIKNAK